MSSQDKALKERNETLQKYVSDMLAVEQHIGEAIKRQIGDEDVWKRDAEAHRILQNITRHNEEHEQHLKQHLSTIGGDPAGGLKEVATSALGVIAGIYDKIRNETVSKMLRDDYTALNLAAVSYEMLHTTGLALQDQKTADLALRHLEHYTTLIMDINKIIPRVVVTELRDDAPVTNQMAAQQAIDNTQRAWQPSSGNGGGRRTV